MNKMNEAFKKLFGDMYLNDSQTAKQIFEYGYKAGVAAENEACAKVCEAEIGATLGMLAAAIRARMK